MECKNCKNELDQNAKFCQECGAKVISHRITMGHLASEMKSGFFSIDSSKPVRTFIDMILRPEIVIDGYIKGTRKKFIHAFGYFTIAVLFSTFFYFIAQNFFPESIEAAYAQFIQDGAQQEVIERIQKKTFEYQSAIFYVSIPIMALISFLIFYNKKKYNFAEHLVFNLYTYSQISIMSILLNFATIWNEAVFSYLQLFSILFQIGFYSYVVIRVFKLSFKQFVLKLLYFLIILFVVYIGILILFMVGLVITGNIEVLKSMAIPPPQ